MAFPLMIVALIVCFWFLARKANGSARLPVLMYHKVISEGEPDFLSVKKEMLEQQFEYLNRKGYTSISLTELQDFVLHGKVLPPRACLLSFDDGYQDNYSIMFPLLTRYGLKANIFAVAGFVCGRNPGNGQAYLQPHEIKEMIIGNVEFGLHSYNHDSYAKLSLEEIALDIDKCKEAFADAGIRYVPCVAYPFGDFLKRNRKKRLDLFDLFKAKGIAMAFRIGNRINKVPLKQRFLIQRIDVRGNESLEQFKRALKYGKKLV